MQTAATPAVARKSSPFRAQGLVSRNVSIEFPSSVSPPDLLKPIERPPIEVELRVTRDNWENLMRSESDLFAVTALTYEVERMWKGEPQLMSLPDQALAILAQCSSLRCLIFAAAGNYCNVVGTQLAAALPHCLLLQHLNVAKNEIGDEGATALAAVLPQSLQHLDVSSSGIRAQGSAALAAGLARCPGLQHLDMSGSCVGGFEFVAALPSGIGLQNMFLSRCSLSGDGLIALIRVLPVLRSLQHVDLFRKYF